MTIITEITGIQRDMMVKLAHARMTEMRNADINAWMSSEYAELENLVYNLHHNAA